MSETLYIQGAHDRAYHPSWDLPELPTPVAGVDEVGRGPLAGPVVAAAVILDPQCDIAGLADSKRLTANKRTRIASMIREQAIAYAVAMVDATVIDEINILQASLQAMHEAVSQLAVTPRHLLIDGSRCPAQLPCPATAIVRGDAGIRPIAAASILAKVARDHFMEEIALQYPGYGFASHKGYPTVAHRQALQRLGPCPLHRRSFAPVRQALQIQSAVRIS
jgi:ribonuclease HII